MKAGDPNIKVTQVDVDNLRLNLQFAKAKRCEAAAGLEKAMAGLREAIGLCQTDVLLVPDEALPSLVEGFDKACLIQWALTRRGEIAQAAGAAEVADLEISAQRRLLFRPLERDHVRRPARHARQADSAGPAPNRWSSRARQHSRCRPRSPAHHPERTGARPPISRTGPRRGSSDKTRNLITLEVEAAYLKWDEAACKVKLLAGAPEMAAKTAKTVQGRFDQGATSGEDLIRARTQEDYAQAQYNRRSSRNAVALATNRTQ